MTDDNALVYDFEGINSIAAQIETFVKDMDGTLDDVDSAFRNLLANGWTGAGASAFQDHSLRWHTKAGEMATTLRKLSSAAGNAAVNMHAADQAAAARFGH